MADRRTRSRRPSWAPSPFTGSCCGLGFGVRAARGLRRRRADGRADDRLGARAPSDFNDSAGNVHLVDRRGVGEDQPVDAGASGQDRALGYPARVDRDRYRLPAVGGVPDRRLHPNLKCSGRDGRTDRQRNRSPESLHQPLAGQMTPSAPAAGTQPRSAPDRHPSTPGRLPWLDG